MLYGLRHGSATMALAAGVPIKAISEMLGHGTSAFTADLYTEVAEELTDAAASAIAVYAPHRCKIVPGAIFCAIRKPR
jgi:integrase